MAREHRMDITCFRRLTPFLWVLVLPIAGVVFDTHAATIQKHTVNAELPPGQNPTYAFGDRVLWLVKGHGPIAEVVTGVSKSVVSWIKGDGCHFAKFKASRHAPGPRWKNCFGNTGSAKVARVGKSKLYPLKVGNTAKWKVRGKNPKGDKWTSIYQCEVRGTANVTVPAGKFDAYHVVCMDDWAIENSYVSPELKIPILIEISPTKKDSKGPRLYQELLDYSPVNVTGDTASSN